MKQEDINGRRKQATDAWYSQKESLEGFDMQAHFESGYDAALDALAPTLIAQAERVKVLEEALSAARSDCKLVVDILGNSGPEFNSVKDGIAIIIGRIDTALEQTGASNG